MAIACLKPREPMVRRGFLLCLGVSSLSNPNVLLTGAQAARLLKVAPSTICAWVEAGHLTEAERRGQSPLYRWGDLSKAERRTRLSPHSSRNPDRALALEASAA